MAFGRCSDKDSYISFWVCVVNTCSRTRINICCSGFGARRALELTEREEDELLAEWQPEPLGAALHAVRSALWLLVDPLGPRLSLPSCATFFLSAVPKDQPVKAAPHDFVISEYVPGGRQVIVKIEGDNKNKVTFCSQDFVGNGIAPEVRATANETLENYTVGSCGPRGFYGTTKAHLELEESLATFMGTPESITYSDSTATTASAIPAFAKRGDTLLVDAGASFAVQLGARLSRSKTLYFRHNDMDDLQRLLQGVRDHDETVVDDSLSQRRFIIVEGLYGHYGDLCPLPEVLRLAREYKWRVILDDSYGVGVLGATGRGIVEHYGLNTGDIDVLIGSLATSLSSIGGFCVGSREVVDHQRLSGAGYCFSASAPPFTCATATAALRRIIKTPQLLTQLRDRSMALHAALVSRIGGFTVTSDPVSPIKHLQLAVGPAAHFPRAITSDILLATPLLASGSGTSGLRLPLPSPAPLVPTAHTVLSLRREEEDILKAIVLRAAANGVLLTRSHFLDIEGTAPRPTLKISVTLAHTEADIELLLQVLAFATSAVLGLGNSSPSHGKAVSSGSSASSASGTGLYKDKANGLASPLPKGSPVSSKRGASRTRTGL